MYGSPYDQSDAYKLQVAHYERDWKKTWRNRQLEPSRSLKVAGLLTSILRLFIG